jgi:hypothetical protein
MENAIKYGFLTCTPAEPFAMRSIAAPASTESRTSQIGTPTLFKVDFGNQTVTFTTHPMPDLA